MITYYLDNTLDPATPLGVMNRAIRAAVNQRGQTVAFAIDNLQFTYDMLNGVNNPANVRMVDADLTAAGACAPSPCSPNSDSQSESVHRTRSAQPFSATNQFFRSTLRPGEPAQPGVGGLVPVRRCR